MSDRIRAWAKALTFGSMFSWHWKEPLWLVGSALGKRRRRGLSIRNLPCPERLFPRDAWRTLRAEARPGERLIWAMFFMFFRAYA